jgi:hypothetical protein
MFSKLREIRDSDILDTSAFDELFGDESAAEISVEIHDLRNRVRHVESQINSQFTSLATYAQIAQEQVELVRAEATAATGRSEQRLTALIERERTDRIESDTGEVPTGRCAIAPEFTDRLDALEQSVAEIRAGLDTCVEHQQALAHAITAMFEWLAPLGPGGARGAGLRSPQVPKATTTDESPLTPPRTPTVANHPPSGPIPSLSLDG